VKEYQQNKEEILVEISMNRLKETTNPKAEEMMI